MNPLISFEFQTVLSIIITLFSYFFARFIYLKANKNIILQPMLIATSLLIVFVILFNTPLDEYQTGTGVLTWMIAPLSISLMVPLASNIKEIGKILPSILFTLLICATFTVSITLLIAKLLGTSQLSLLSLSSKSVTTPIALVISNQVGGIPSLAALIVIITGVIGVITAPLVFKMLNINDDRAKGITLGLTAHIIGSAYAMEYKSPDDKKISNTIKKNRYAAFSIVSMSLTALLSALLLPWLLPYFL